MTEDKNTQRGHTLLLQKIFEINLRDEKSTKRIACIENLITQSNDGKELLPNGIWKTAGDKKVTIVHKCITRGHAQMGKSSIHSHVKLKKKPLYVPQNYIDLLNLEIFLQKYPYLHITYTLNLEDIKHL